MRWEGQKKLSRKVSFLSDNVAHKIIMNLKEMNFALYSKLFKKRFTHDNLLLFNFLSLWQFQKNMYETLSAMQWCCTFQCPLCQIFFLTFNVNIHNSHLWTM